MELTEKEINRYIEFLRTSRQIYEEVSWLIKYHVDDKGKENIKEVVDYLNG